jgi:hypothetical protein
MDLFAIMADHVPHRPILLSVATVNIHGLVQHVKNVSETIYHNLFPIDSI